MSTPIGFEHVLFDMKRGMHGLWRRRGWKANAFIFVAAPQGFFEGFIAISTDEGKRAPWTPSRCDLFENDWERFA